MFNYTPNIEVKLNVYEDKDYYDNIIIKFYEKNPNKKSFSNKFERKQKTI